jgi:transposase
MIAMWTHFSAACSFGKWQTVYDRHRRWSADGTWERFLRAIQAAADAVGRIDWSVVSVDFAGQSMCRGGAIAPLAPFRRGGWPLTG